MIHMRLAATVQTLKLSTRSQSLLSLAALSLKFTTGGPGPDFPLEPAKELTVTDDSTVPQIEAHYHSHKKKNILEQDIIQDPRKG